MRAGLCLAVIATLLGVSEARADGNPRRRTGTKLAHVGLAGTLTGIAVGAFAIGLGNDRPEAAKPFYAASAIAFGVGAVGFATGFYLRATSPVDPPDAITLDPVRARHRNERRAGIAIGGLGAAVLITGIAHGIGAWRDNDLAAAQCPNGVCTANGARLLSRAHTLALAADMLIGTGALGLAGGIILYRGGRDDGPRVVPVVAPDQVTAAVSGRF
jgi:hypothetical protein